MSAPASDAYALALAVASQSGLDALRAIHDGSLPRPPINELLGITGARCEPGLVEIRCTPTEAMLSHRGTIAGGWVLTLLYVAGSCAVETTLEQGLAHSPVQTSSSLVRHILPATGEVSVVGETSHRGRTLATATARAMQVSTGKLLAEGSITCIVQPLSELLERRG